MARLVTSDRIVGALLAAFAVWYGVAAGEYKAGFSDPLGPAVFPRLLSVPLGLLALYLVIRPDAEPVWPRGAAILRQAAAVAILTAYALAVGEAGFLVTTIIGVTLLARLLGAGWGQGGAVGVAISLALFGLFDYVLGLPLPRGTLISGG